MVEHRRYTKPVMLRRLTALLLVALFATSGLAICPAGICPMTKKAASDCCTKGDGIKRPDCCPAATEQVSASLVTTGAAERFAAAHVVLGPGVSVPTAVDVRGEGTLPASAARGASPPASLFTQQTSLLL
jgi:hypothetical protein